jgi:predicted nucleic acid-binding protein
VTNAVLLDTSIVIGAEQLDLDEYRDRTAAVSAVTIGELAFGADLGPDPDARHARLRAVLDNYEVLPYGVEEAKLYGVLASLLRARGRNPRPRRLDLQIAATAAGARLQLLTCNPADFVGIAPLVDVVAVGRAG